MSNTSPRNKDEHGTLIVAPGTDSGKRCQPPCSAEPRSAGPFHAFVGRRTATPSFPILTGSYLASRFGVLRVIRGSSALAQEPPPIYPCNPWL